MATYVNNLRLTELATGEGSGSWGTTTNSNLEFIGEALGFGTQNCFASNANSTTTVADGASDPARSFYFKVTSGATLSTTRVLTIAPNTLNRVMFIENATTGSQTITIKQGSGATVNIASGAVKAVYLDGAGSGAAVADALVDLDLTGTTTMAALNTSGAITSSGVITGTTVEATATTSAGDNAAIGYTSANGLMITGQGSTNDVTIQNDAAADVIEIPTGTVKAVIAGLVEIESGNISIKNGGTRSTVKFYCESNNAHYAQVQAPAHSAFSGNVTLTLPASTDTLAGIAATQTLTNKTLTTPVLTTPIANAGIQLKNGATGAGFLQFFEDSDNGANKVTLIGPAATADITLTLPSSAGSNGQFLKTDGNGVLSFAAAGGLYNDWAIKTGAYTMVSGDQIIVNASGGTTITLPASSAAGATVTIKATGGGTVTIGRNSQKINSVAGDGTLQSGKATQLVFVDSTIGFLEL